MVKYIDLFEEEYVILKSIYTYMICRGFSLKNIPIGETENHEPIYANKIYRFGQNINVHLKIQQIDNSYEISYSLEMNSKKISVNNKSDYELVKKYMFFENIVNFCFLENKKISTIAKLINMTNFYSIYQIQDDERYWNKMRETFNKIFFDVDYFTDPFPFNLELISDEFLIKFSSNGYICCVTNSDRLKNPHNIIFYIVEYFYQRIFDVTKIQSHFIEHEDEIRDRIPF